MDAMLDIFRYMVYQYLMIYIDDILIYIRMHEEHVREWRKILQLLEEQKFHLRASKCQFFGGKLEILAHILTSDGLHVNTKKKSTILEFLTPIHKKDLRGFLKVVNYLLWFLPGLTSNASTVAELWEK